jgi:hypothetical protein
MFVSPHWTGHATARDGRLLRIDPAAGGRWVATRYNPDLTIHDVFYGSEGEVHAVVAHWRMMGIT